jgi:predicted kinase
MKTSKPILFATLGYPGSGKTFFSRRFARDFGLFHLNSDRLRSEMFPEATRRSEENAAVFRTMNYLVEELLSRGVSVIYDANSTRRIFRRRYRQIAKKLGADYLLLWFRTPVETALRCLRKRAKLKSEALKRYHRPISDSVLFDIRAEDEPPVREPHVILEPGSYQEQKAAVLKFLKSRK